MESSVGSSPSTLISDYHTTEASFKLMWKVAVDVLLRNTVSFREVCMIALAIASSFFHIRLGWVGSGRHTFPYFIRLKTSWFSGILLRSGVVYSGALPM